MRNVGNQFFLHRIGFGNFVAREIQRFRQRVRFRSVRRLSAEIHRKISRRQPLRLFRHLRQRPHEESRNRRRNHKRKHQHKHRNQHRSAVQLPHHRAVDIQPAAHQQIPVVRYAHVYAFRVRLAQFENASSLRPAVFQFLYQIFRRGFRPVADNVAAGNGINHLPVLVKQRRANVAFRRNGAEKIVGVARRAEPVRQSLVLRLHRAARRKRFFHRRVFVRLFQRHALRYAEKQNDQ